MMSEIEKLGATINSRIHSVGKATEGMGPEIGTITSSLGLQVNSVRNTIPKGDYLVARDITQGGTFTTSTTENHKHTTEGEDTGEAGKHSHTVEIPSKSAPLKVGDRVLVIWCGYEPVVAAVLIES